MIRKSKLRILKPCVALFFAVWAITPFLFLSCTTAKSVENNSTLRTDTVVVERTDTIKEVIREFVKDEQRQKDSISVTTKNDTVWVDRWHVKETIKYLVAKNDKQQSSTQMESQKSTEKQTEEKDKVIEKQDPMKDVATLLQIVLTTVVLLVLLYERWRSRRNSELHN